MNKSTHRQKKARIGMNQSCDNRDRTVKVFLKETGQEEKFKLLTTFSLAPSAWMSLAF